MISKAHWQGGRVCLPLVPLVCCILVCSITLSASAGGWWNGAVFYEVFVRSFSDSNGDGIGDLRSLIEKLDYLNDGDPSASDDLGITAGTPGEPLSADWLGRNVAAQTDTADSLLSTYRTLIRLRDENPILRSGDLILVDAGHPSILSYLRNQDGSLVWVLHNLSAVGARPSKAVPETLIPVYMNSMYPVTDLLEGIDSFPFRVTSESYLEGVVPALAPCQTVILALKLL